MKSYILAVTITMFLSALFAFQNMGDVTVRFLMFEWVFPQGVWEVLIFGTGAVLMWIFSMFSQLEGRGKYKKLLREKDEKIAAVEKEKQLLLESISAARNAAPTEAAVVETAAAQVAEPSAESESTTETA